MEEFRFKREQLQRANAIADAAWGLVRDWVHLIASASYPFPEVLDAMAQPLMAFPVEGLPGHRYFPGTSAMDEIEDRSEQLLRLLFSANDFDATIQPHSGTQANQIVFNAVLKPEDVVLSLSPSSGGHISHTVLLGRRNAVVHYRVGPDGKIDGADLRNLAHSARPKLIIAGGSALPREFDFKTAYEIAGEVGALLHADVSHTALFIAAGIHAPVARYADFISFNMVKNLRGPAGGVLMYRKKHATPVRRALFPDTQGGPNETVLFAKYVALEMLTRRFVQDFASAVVANARTMCEVFRLRGIPVVTAGTDSHIVLLDLSGSEITGLDAERRCENNGILTNRNLVPGDLRKPEVASGLRLGAACISILGYEPEDVRRLSDVIADLVLDQTRDISEVVRHLTARYNKPFARIQYRQ